MSADFKFHPLAGIFPLMEGAEFDALVADIKANGLYHSIELYDGMILDGRNRYRALRALGWHPDQIEEQALALTTGPSGTDTHMRVDDPVAYIISKNIHRRHLTPEQKRDLIAKLLGTDPGKSDRQIAETVKASPTFVGKVRAEEEAAGLVSTVDTRIDKRGRKQPAKKSDRKQPVPKPVKPDPRIISPKLADRVGRFASDLILSDRLLARELANLIMLPGVRERLSADLTNGLALDAGVDAGPLRRRS